jgi:hypothetical protein
VVEWAPVPAWTPLGIEPRFLGRSARSQVIIPTDLHPVYQLQSNDNDDLNDDLGKAMEERDCDLFKVQQILANSVTVNPYLNMKNEKFCSQLSTYFKRHVGFRNKRD